MSDHPRDLTLERVNRLTLAIADLTESHAAQGRRIPSMMQRLLEHMERIDKSVRELASEQVLPGNRLTIQERRRAAE